MKYKFKDEKLLEQALTHKSMGEFNYEDLEFLGDAVLDFIVVNHLCALNNFTFKSEEEVSSLKQMIVTNQNFARISVALRFNVHLKASPAYLDPIETFVKELDWNENILEVGLHSAIAPKILGDIFESLCAAVLLDS